VTVEEDLLQRMKADIRARLRPVCEHMSENVFEELVEKIALNEKRALQRSAENWGTLRG
jgi:hypothetical protein